MWKGLKLVVMNLICMVFFLMLNNFFEIEIFKIYYVLKEMIIIEYLIEIDVFLLDILISKIL